MSLKLPPWRGPGRRYERHYAISLDGLKMKFVCPRGHQYVRDYGKGPKHLRPGELWLRRMLSYWSRENNGCSVGTPCPKCAASESQTPREVKRP